MSRQRAVHALRIDLYASEVFLCEVGICFFGQDDQEIPPGLYQLFQGCKRPSVDMLYLFTRSVCGSSVGRIGDCRIEAASGKIVVSFPFGVLPHIRSDEVALLNIELAEVLFGAFHHMRIHVGAVDGEPHEAALN